MKVQIIGNSTHELFRFFSNITTSLLCAPKSLDEFDINIIDLTSPNIWEYSERDPVSISCINDFISIQKMVKKKSSSIVIFQIPKNLNYHYWEATGGDKYYSSKPLKDMLDTIGKNILNKIIPDGYIIPSLVFENTRTKIGDVMYEADFYFDTEYNILTESIRSKKVTSIVLKENSIYITTLNIAESKKCLDNFLSTFFAESEKDPAPKWMKDFQFFDDNEQYIIIQKNETEIEEAKQRIIQAQEKLSKNAEYKSVLYTNGDKLVSVVFQMLEQLLECNLSEFVDERKEDFLIRKDSLTFIGEIKGVTSNVKNEHISQVDVHYQGYIDKLMEEQREENVHQLLIINALRTKPLCEREPIGKQQIELANRNGCLIIETTTLLRIFEKFLRHEITSEQSMAVFSNSIGLLNVSDFEKQESVEIESHKS